MESSKLGDGSHARQDSGEGMETLGVVFVAHDWLRTCPDETKYVSWSGYEEAYTV